LKTKNMTNQNSQREDRGSGVEITAENDRLNLIYTGMVRIELIFWRHLNSRSIAPGLTLTLLGMWEDCRIQLGELDVTVRDSDTVVERFNRFFRESVLDFTGLIINLTDIPL